MKAKFQIIGVTINNAKADEVIERDGKKFRREVIRRIAQVRGERINTGTKPIHLTGSFELTGDPSEDVDIFTVGKVVQVEVTLTDERPPDPVEERIG